MKKVVHITDKDKDSRWSEGPTDSVILHNNFGVTITFKMLHLQIMVLGSIHFKYMSDSTVSVLKGCNEQYRLNNTQLLSFFYF